MTEQTHEPDTRDDQQAEQVSEAALKTMTPEEIVAARKAGRMADLGYAGDAR